jgi:hypothetical protein
MNVAKDSMSRAEKKRKSMEMLERRCWYKLEEG